MAKHRTATSRRSKWYHSDQPYNSQFMVFSNRSARVKPNPDGGFEWSIWIGPPTQRVLHNSGLSNSLASAKRIAAQKLAKYEQEGG
jgi:hypothetical protein